LKLAHSITAGLDHILKDPIVTDTDIPITTVSGIHGPPISEWVIMNWLVASRIYDKTAAWQREHIWQDDKGLIQMMQDHVEMRVGILGYGSIGRQGKTSSYPLNASGFNIPHSCSRCCGHGHESPRIYEFAASNP
jgi:phosphoglycerate dehydrogenase-like enzyme